jgi:hypothetical protein
VDVVGIAAPSHGDHDGWRAAVHGDFAEHDAISNFGLRVMGSNPGTDFV